MLRSNQMQGGCLMVVAAPLVIIGLLLVIRACTAQPGGAGAAFPVGLLILAVGTALHIVGTRTFRRVSREE